MLRVLLDTSGATYTAGVARCCQCVSRFLCTCVSEYGVTNTLHTHNLIKTIPEDGLSQAVCRGYDRAASIAISMPICVRLGFLVIFQYAGRWGIPQPAVDWKNGDKW